MDVKIRNLEEKDYDTLKVWWKWHRFTPPPKHILPSNGKDGIMLKNGNVDVCAGFLYATSSPYLYWVEWIVSNPDVKDKKIRDICITTLIQSLSQMAKNMGATTIYTTLKNENLKQKFLDSGYKVSGYGNIEMIKSLV